MFFFSADDTSVCANGGDAACLEHCKGLQSAGEYYNKGVCSDANVCMCSTYYLV